MWTLNDKPSLRFVKDTITALRNKEVQLRLTSTAVYTSQAYAAIDAGTGAQLT